MYLYSYASNSAICIQRGYPFTTEELIEGLQWKRVQEWLEDHQWNDGYGGSSVTLKYENDGFGPNELPSVHYLYLNGGWNAFFHPDDESPGVLIGGPWKSWYSVEPYDELLQAYFNKEGK
jgi:hypothetical protein